MNVAIIAKCIGVAMIVWILYCYICINHVIFQSWPKTCINNLDMNIAIIAKCMGIAWLCIPSCFNNWILLDDQRSFMVFVIHSIQNKFYCCFKFLLRQHVIRIRSLQEKWISTFYICWHFVCPHAVFDLCWLLLLVVNLAVKCLSTILPNWMSWNTLSENRQGITEIFLPVY